MTLQDRVLQIDHIQARRFSKLTGDAVEIAAIAENVVQIRAECIDAVGGTRLDRE